MDTGNTSCLIREWVLGKIGLWYHADSNRIEVSALGSIWTLIGVGEASATVNCNKK